MSTIYENIDQVLSDEELKSNQDPKDARSDPTGQHPKTDYFFTSGVGKYARGTDRKNVYTGGSVADIDLDLDDEPVATYTNSQVKETPSGHIIEYDDTPGVEKIMLRHRSGSGIEMRADGTMIYSSTNNSIKITAHDEKVIVDGDGEIQYNGNLKLKVAGDFDLEVGGDYNVTVDGDIEQKVKRGINTQVSGSIETEITGNNSTTVIGANSNLVFGDNTNIVKSSNSLFVGQDQNFNVGGTLFMTAENEVSLSTKSANIAASSLSVFGDSGTIGGDEIVMYGKAAHIPRINSTSMHATTFHGTLNGKASFAAKADEAGSAPSGPGSGGGTQTISTATDKDTVRPTTNILNDLLENSPLSIRRVDIDEGDLMKNSVDKTTKFGGVSNSDLNTRQARSKLRDPNNINNETFVGACITDGIISADFASMVPKLTNRTSSNEKISSLGSRIIGKSRNTAKRFTTKETSSVTTDFFVDPKYNPVFQDIITSRTKLAPGIPMAKFLGGVGDPVTLTHILEDSEKLRLAKQYVLHAHAMKLINSSTGAKRFNEFRLQVVEGLYRAEAGEDLDVSDGVNYLMSRGLAVVYELIGEDGEIDVEKTYELATYWKNNLQFDKLILDYDTYNPDNSINAQIILIMPEILPPWSVKYKNDVETRYNNNVQTTNELIEVLA
tara:strand:- start:3229 stop:5229 length:2001 start_codon:yes stop_codon:yes gene_type:complete